MKLDDLASRLAEVVKEKIGLFEERILRLEKRVPEKGDVGPKGEKGEHGDRGDRGETGEKGERGPQGEHGEVGPAGAQGVKGDTGERGEKGDIGPQGIAGEKGLNGKDGAPGVQGDRGEKGDAGKDGQSAYSLAVEKGFAGSELEWLESIRGVHGKDGRDGREGKDGRDGRDGEPGRDAAAIHVLDSIDEEKSYPRGTFAHHKDGFWYAAEKTQGMIGWKCLAPGIHGFETELKDFRHFTVSAVLSDGRKFSKEFDLPVVLHRGVYEEGRTYTLGDQVQWAGCQWIAIVEKATNRPMFHLPPGMTEADRHWVLAVKKGDKGDSGSKK